MYLINYISYSIKAVFHGKHDIVIANGIVAAFRCFLSSAVQLGTGRDLCFALTMASELHMGMENLPRQTRLGLKPWQ